MERAMNNVTVTYLEGRDDWAGGEWVAQPDGDDYSLCVPCGSDDLSVSREPGASVLESSKVLSACFGEDWRATKDEPSEPVVISAWTCVVRDRSTIDDVLRTSKRVARMVRKYIPEIRYVHAKNLERDVQLVDWSECDGKFVNTIRMSVVASESSVRCVEEMCASNRSVRLRLSLWCVVGRNDSCEVFWNLHSVEGDDTAAQEDPEPSVNPSPPLATEDEVRRLRRTIERATTRHLPALEDSDSDDAEGDDARLRLAELRSLVTSAEAGLAGDGEVFGDWVADVTRRLKALMRLRPA